MTNPAKGASYALEVTAWQDAVGTSKARWDWLEEMPRVGDVLNGRNGSQGGSSGYPGVFGAELEKACGNADAEALIKRPEHSIFGLAMVGGGRVFGQAHLYGQFAAIISLRDP